MTQDDLKKMEEDFRRDRDRRDAKAVERLAAVYRDQKYREALREIMEKFCAR